MNLAEPLDALVERVHNDWRPLLDAWRRSAAGRRLIEQVDARVAAGAVVYPADVFRALRLTPLRDVRVLILGQDPYHGAGQAEGLAFSVPPGQPPPPSLRNVFGELRRDLGLPIPACGSLQAWAERGILLLNTSLTVEQGRPGSHSRLGWEVLTDRIIVAVDKHLSAKVFMLWGTHAQRKAPMIDAAGGRHLLLQCNHPSPLSARRGRAPFIGCAHFSRAKAFVQCRDAARDSLDWGLPEAERVSPGKSGNRLKVV